MNAIVASGAHALASINAELPAYLKPDEIARVLACAKSNEERLLMNFLWKTGARITEVVGGDLVTGVTLADIDHDKDLIRITTVKRKKKVRGRKSRVVVRTEKDRPFRWVPLDDKLGKDILLYTGDKKIPKHEPFLQMTRLRAYRIVKRAVLAAGLDGELGHPHTFRHSFAIHCVNSQVPIHVLKEWLGHANIMNTAVYLKVLATDTREFYRGIIW